VFSCPTKFGSVAFILSVNNVLHLLEPSKPFCWVAIYKVAVIVVEPIQPIGAIMKESDKARNRGK
jgi:hypothetical protein